MSGPPPLPWLKKTLPVLQGLVTWGRVGTFQHTSLSLPCIPLYLPLDDINLFLLDNLANCNKFDFLHVLENKASDEFEFNDSPYSNINLNCTYVDETTFNSKFSNTNHPSLMSINIQSLTAKFSELSQMIYVMSQSNTHPDIICLRELWQFPDNLLFDLPGYHPLVYNLRKNAQGGGVGIFIRSNLKFNVLHDKSIFSERLFESLLIEVFINPSNPIIIGSLYRPGTKHPILSTTDQNTNFLEYFANLCSSLSSLQTPVYLLGDLNIDVLQYGRCELSTNYVDLLFSYGLLQIITKPTRCTYNSATLIDHLITNMCNKDLSSFILISHISDHFPIVHHIKKISANRSEKKPFCFRDFSEANTNSFYNVLNNVNWSSVYCANDAQLSCN